MLVFIYLLADAKEISPCTKHAIYQKAQMSKKKKFKN